MGYTYTKTNKQKLLVGLQSPLRALNCKGEAGTKSESYPKPHIKPHTFPATSSKLPEESRVFLLSGPQVSLSVRKMEGSDMTLERKGALPICEAAEWAV